MRIRVSACQTTYCYWITQHLIQMHRLQAILKVTHVYLFHSSNLRIIGNLASWETLIPSDQNTNIHSSFLKKRKIVFKSQFRSSSEATSPTYFKQIPKVYRKYETVFRQTHTKTVQVREWSRRPVKLPWNWLLRAKFTYSPFTMVIEDNKILKCMQEGTSQILQPLMNKKCLRLYMKILFTRVTGSLLNLHQN